ncbi:MAG: P-loop containing nucleoside triphosphate hydrolase protein [Olpidium bornovanus]|uniref:P-loop containing nucleoside triphosphate hydrolase protein n=1 Tax=Olpidium bornovanus TaxID=278681 RepID=A0A8H7ZY88_9FUNG|nr:MAG: P-loop containing nucleoside triphosphate hydrolase protein [Olpidium bornovanus]
MLVPIQSPTYGHWEKSGKMLVVKAVLEMWHRDKHRVLLFSQTRQMLDILERLARTLGHQYRRMDGTTPVANRHALVDEFNARKDIFLFLLTTKVGGLGVNLTGADRVCIYDPDWNPSTDVQARERAWRLGQKKDVTIYRLMTSGTIEEKIYHRQIFKTFLTNKILKDPKQKRFFKSSDLNDLFSLTSEDSAATGTETGELFEGTEVVAPARPAKNKRRNSGEAGRPRTKRERRREGEADNLASIGELAGVEEYRPPGARSEPGGGEGGEERQSAGEDGHDDSHILESLFEMTGIHSALKHDSIMDGARQEDIIVEREAARVAEEAVLALKESRKRRRAQDIGVPTWTGRSGSAGGPRFGTRTSGPRFLLSAHPSSLQRSTEGFGSGALSGFRGLAAAPSSSSVLSNMKHRSAPGDRRRQPGDRTAKSGGSGEAIEAKLMDESKRENLVVKIREFLCLRGEAGMSSSEIVENFKLRIRDEDVPMFRKMLRGIADFHREADGNGYWKLKADFL